MSAPIVHPKRDGGLYACACLNVNVQPSSTSAVAPPITQPNQDYNQVFVDEQGIQIRHTQLVLRTRSRSFPVPGSSNRRYVSLTCLVCNTIVYRVEQAISADVEGKEGPVLPSPDWAEQEILKSPTGFIELHKGCIKGDEITRRRVSTNYNPLYDILFTSNATPGGAPQTSTIVADRKHQYFTHIPTLFPPPPYVPTHPTFRHLAQVAETESAKLRAEAEAQFATLLQEKTAQLIQQAAALRGQTETLWKTYEERIKTIASSTVNHRDNLGEPTVTSESTSQAPQRVREFAPTKSAQRSEVVPKMSSLSASLATSSFHHPKAMVTSSANAVDSAPTPNAAVTSTSPRTASSATLPANVRSGFGDNVGQFHRRLDDDTNTSASFWLLSELDNEMKKRDESRAAQLKATQEPQQQSGKPADKPRPPQPETDRKEKEVPSPNGKGKRKVTFNVEGADQEEVSDEDEKTKDEGMFPMDDEDDSQPRDHLGVPSVEQTASVQKVSRTRAPRKSNGTDVSTSFPALRPSSLPAPSTLNALNLRTSVPPTEDKKPTASHKESARDASLRDGVLVDDGVDHYRQTEIMKLFNAQTPSHRSAWKSESQAWQGFVGNQRQEKSRIDPTGDVDAFVPGSLAIPLNAALRPKEELTLASYRPETGPPPAQTNGRRDTTSEPGVLDFTVDEEDEDDYDNDPADLPSGERSRHRALKILQAGQRVPAAGMWRSLA